MIRFRLVILVVLSALDWCAKVDGFSTLLAHFAMKDILIKRIPRHLRSRQVSLHLETESKSSWLFCRRPPYLAIITEPDACESIDRMEETTQAVKRALRSGHISLVSVRVVRPNAFPLELYEARVEDLIRRLLGIAHECNVPLVVSSDWVKEALQAKADGIHVRERDCARIPEIREQFGKASPLIGTSVHSVASGLEAQNYDPDYLFVGTCYATASHPGKEDLEGPELPGKVKSAIEQAGGQPVIVFAIGGIDQTNCAEPLQYGADGVAVIRAVLLATDPKQAVDELHRALTLR
jgi:thiamine-phosphate pyrophosphorylase